MADSPLGSSAGFLLFNLEIRWVLILMNADMAINLALESKDAINCELIRTIHKAPELTSLFFYFFPEIVRGSKPKEKKRLCS